jgi:hypothetical protein
LFLRSVYVNEPLIVYDCAFPVRFFSPALARLIALIQPKGRCFGPVEKYGKTS